jgi:hypothetical protein
MPHVPDFLDRPMQIALILSPKRYGVGDEDHQRLRWAHFAASSPAFGRNFLCILDSLAFGDGDHSARE